MYSIEQFRLCELRVSDPVTSSSELPLYCHVFLARLGAFEASHRGAFDFAYLRRLAHVEIDFAFTRYALICIRP